MTVIPLESVAYRTGAVPARDIVAVVDERATKENTQNDPAAAGSGLDLETLLSVRARVRDAGGSGSGWVDVHVFDDDDRLVRSETLPLLHVAGSDGIRELGFDGSVYRGTGASPGSTWLAPDARKVQYRIYFETDGTVFSDGLLRQHDVQPDDSVVNPAAAAAPSGGAPPRLAAVSASPSG